MICRLASGTTSSLHYRGLAMADGQLHFPKSARHWWVIEASSTQDDALETNFLFGG